MKESPVYLDILNSVCCNQVCTREVNLLIEKSYVFSVSYLRFHHSSLKKSLLAENTTLQELAVDAIAPLFERNEKGELIKLKTAFKNWQPPIDNEVKALFFINMLVSKSVEKYISEILRNSDPFFSKILDSITYISAKQHIIKTQILGTTYLVEDEGIKGIVSLPDSNFISDLPSHLFFDINKTIPAIFNYIRVNSDKAAAIPLNALIMKIKQVRSSDFIFPSTTLMELDFDVISVVDKALDATIKKLYESYAHKGKLSETEVSVTEQVIRNIAFDLKDGGINPGLHKYFMEQLKDITFDEYKNRYQNMLEYLFKVLKREIADQLNAE